MVRAEVTVISFSGFDNRWFDPLVLGHLVPAQTALLCGHIRALVTGVLSIVLRFLLLRRRLVPRVVDLIKAIPESDVVVMMDGCKCERIM